MAGKKILIFDIGAVLKDHYSGGAQKILTDISLHLGKNGHKIDIFCAKRDDCFKPYKLSKNVIVNPVLEFKQPFPFAYKVSPHKLTKIIKTISNEIDKHDIFYSHGSGLDFPFLYDQKIPTIVSLRDFHYPETLIGAFGFRRDKLIVNSTNVRDCVISSIGEIMPDIGNRIKLIHNGVDTNFYKKVTPSKIYKYINKKINNNQFKILFPHRPDPSKGIFEALKLINNLKRNRKKINFVMLVPRSIDDRISTQNFEHYKMIENYISDNDLEENIIFHDWIPYNLMPEYFSLGDLTLVIGNFIEAFGSNTAIESLSCGTPVIMSRIGANRTTLPENQIFKIDYGDLDKAENIIISLIENKDKEINKRASREFIMDNFSYDKMLNCYENEILNTRISPPLKLNLNINVSIKQLVIAPWAYLSKRGLYHDYDQGYTQISKKLTEILNKGEIDIEKVDLSLKEEIKILISRGLLVKKFKK